MKGLPVALIENEASRETYSYHLRLVALTTQTPQTTTTDRRYYSYGAVLKK